MDFIRLFKILYDNRPDTLNEYGFFIMLIDEFIKVGSKNPFGGIQPDTVERYLRRQRPFNKKRLRDTRKMRNIDGFASFIGKYFDDTQKFNIETEIQQYKSDFNEDGNEINYPIANLFLELLDELIGEPASPSSSLTSAPVPIGAADSSSAYYYDPTDQKIHIGGHIINLPPELLPPDDIDHCDRFVQPKERKGVCHLLANDGVIHWVQEDE